MSTEHGAYWRPTVNFERIFNVYSTHSRGMGMSPISCHVLVLAAGFGRRMRGTGDKLLQTVEGAPLLRTLALRALASGRPVTITLPPGEDGAARRAALAGLEVTRVPVPDAAEGMAASIRAGVAALPASAAAVMIVPADMPELTGDDLRRIADAAEKPSDPPRVLRAIAADGTPGHPVAFPRAAFPALAELSGDHGARPVLSAWSETCETIALPGRHAILDLDTPEAWAAWYAGHAD